MNYVDQVKDRDGNIADIHDTGAREDIATLQQAVSSIVGFKGTILLDHPAGDFVAKIPEGLEEGVYQAQYVGSQPNGVAFISKSGSGAYYVEVLLGADRYSGSGFPGDVVLALARNTKLYKHSLHLGYQQHHYYFDIITYSSEPIIKNRLCNQSPGDTSSIFKNSILGTLYETGHGCNLIWVSDRSGPGYNFVDLGYTKYASADTGLTVTSMYSILTDANYTLTDTVTVL